MKEKTPLTARSPQEAEANSPGRQAAALAAALLAALLVNVAMPGLETWRGHWWLLPFCLWPLFMAIQIAPRRAGRAGFVFGVAAWLGQLSWVTIVLGRYGGLPSWLSWIVLLLLAAYMALYNALFCRLLLALHRLWADFRPARAAMLALWAPPVVWTGLDALRGQLFTGFPWMDLGYGLFRVPLLLTPADLGGHHLLTFTLVLVNSLLALLPVVLHRSGLKALCAPVASALCLLVMLAGYSGMRQKETRAEIEAVQRASIGLVQANIEQDLKWNPAFKEATVTRYLGLSAGLAKDNDLDLLIWPESALPFYPQDDPLASRVAGFAARGPMLLTGAPFYRVTETLEGRVVQYFNGALLIGPDARVAGTYAKQHLVPFGEYIPLKRLLFFLKPLAETIGDFTPGRHSGPLAAPTPDGRELRPGVLVCYESVFPKIARNSTAQGANFLANLTNDAWYGRSSAPVQSLAMAVLRAVENRRSLVRAANTGISGLIDPLGRITGETGLFTEIAVADSLPLMHSVSVFTKAGHAFGLCCALLILPLLLPVLLRRLGQRAARRQFCIPARTGRP